MCAASDVSVGSLLSGNYSHSGWLKQIVDTPFGKSPRKRYAVLHSGYLYLFKDDQSPSSTDFLYVSQFTILERISQQPQKWGFHLVGERKKGSGEDLLVFTVGSERELKEWLQHLNTGQQSANQTAGAENGVDEKKMTVDYEVGVTDTIWNDAKQPSATWEPPKNPVTTPDDIDYYADPEAGPLFDDESQYLPQSAFQWNLDRNGANDLLVQCGTPGVYLMRKGRDRNDVISAYLLNEPRHFKIFVENNELFLRQDHPRFRKHLHLIMYYHLNNLPTCHARLEAPFTEVLRK